MTKPVTDAMWLAFSVIFYSLALAYALTSLSAVQKQFEISPGTKETVYEVQREIPETPLFTGAQIISSIYKLDFDEYTVTVSGTTFERQTDLRNKQSAILATATYKQNIEYTDTTTRIVYTLE